LSSELAFAQRRFGATIPPEMAADGTERRQAILLAVGGLLHREIAIDELLSRLVERIRLALDADRGTFYLVDHGKSEVFSKAADLPELSEIRLKLGQGVAGHVAATGELINVPTSRGDVRFFPAIDQRTGYQTQSILAAPVRDRRGQIVGVVQLLNKRGGHFSREDEVLLGELAEQAGLAIEATTLYADLQRAPGPSLQPLLLSAQFNRIVGGSEPLRQACRLTQKAAASSATVLLRGESGTGKELFARAIHVNSARSEGPFIKVDCAALPATLIENELFGHERGAYTGADERALGKFELAKGGTIFLDELGELPLAVQGKLLRVLQDRELERVGGQDTVKVDVRVVAATNRDLEQMVEDGRFRADLYYRIKVVEVRLPTLRERGPTDLERLASHFIETAARRHQRPIPRLSPEAKARLLAYAWPGNVRELENCLESAVVIMDGAVIEAGDLALPERAQAKRPEPNGTNAPPLQPIGETLAEVERAHIVRILAEADGNRTIAAKRLGIGRNTLARKLKEYDLG
jgi:Nif-specific regulatory protein